MRKFLLPKMGHLSKSFAYLGLIRSCDVRFLFLLIIIINSDHIFLHDPLVQRNFSSLSLMLVLLRLGRIRSMIILHSAPTYEVISFDIFWLYRELASSEGARLIKNSLDR